MPDYTETCSLCGVPCDYVYSPPMCAECAKADMLAFSQKGLATWEAPPEPGDKVRLAKSDTDWDSYEVVLVNGHRVLVRHHKGVNLVWRHLGNLRLVERGAWSRPRYEKVKRHEEWGFADTLHGIMLLPGEELEFQLPDKTTIRRKVFVKRFPRSIPEPHNNFSYDYWCREAKADLGLGPQPLVEANVVARRAAGIRTIGWTDHSKDGY